MLHQLFPTFREPFPFSVIAVGAGVWLRGCCRKCRPSTSGKIKFRVVLLLKPSIVGAAGLAVGAETGA